jgi:hypothetical protein
MTTRKIAFGIVAAFGLLVVGALITGALISPALAQGPMGGGQGPMGGGMMGGAPYGQAYTGTIPFGYGMMNMMGMMAMMMGGWAGPGGMMGYPGYGQAYTGTVPFGYGMMGNWGAPPANAQPITLDQATQSVDQYLAAANNPDLQVAEVMEFTGNFYAEVHEKSTGTGAFELLVDRYTGAVYPEPGPNMMWNLKYGPMAGGAMMGMMGRSSSPGPMIWWDPKAVKPSVTAEQAVQLAQQYLDQTAQGFTAGDAEPFYGYYTLHVEKDGQITGMLSVNAYTGAVWYHAWHGDFIGMTSPAQ